MTNTTVRQRIFFRLVIKISCRRIIVVLNCLQCFYPTLDEKYIVDLLWSDSGIAGGNLGMQRNEDRQGLNKRSLIFNLTFSDLNFFFICSYNFFYLKRFLHSVFSVVLQLQSQCKVKLQWLCCILNQTGNFKLRLMYYNFHQLLLKFN